MRTLSLFACFLIPALSFEPGAAQSTVKIAGYVFSRSSEPLEGANVVVLGTAFGAATDARGYFAIENLFAGEYTLQASFVGFEKEIRQGVVVQKDFVTRVHFKLHPSVIPFDEIIVESRAEGKFTSAFQEIITAEQIHHSGARTVGELLINIPGVEMIDEGGGAGRKRLSIRGSNSNQVLVLLDGIPLNDPVVGEVDLNQIPLASVEEIRVLKGGNSGMYGGGALGGVVEIISKQYAVDEMRLNGQFGNFGAFGVQPAVSGSFKRVNGLFNFETLNEDGDYPYTYQKLDGATVNETRLNADFSSQNYFGKANLDLNRHVIPQLSVEKRSADILSAGRMPALPPEALHRHSFQIQANLYHSQRGLPGLVFSWTPFAEAKTGRRILLGRYSFQNKNWRSQLQISQHLNETEFQNAPPSDAPLRFRTVPAYHTKYRILSHRGAFESAFQLGKRHAMFFQAFLQVDDFKDQDLLTGFSGPVRETDNLNYSLALRNEWHLPKPDFLSTLLINHAVRFDFMAIENRGRTRSDRQLSPSLGLFVSQNRGWVFDLRVNWGRSFRAPTFADLFFQDFRVRGNANLLPEKSRDFDAGVQLGWPGLGWLEISGAYFRQRVENLIVWELGSFATWQPFNTDALLQGWEFAGSWKVWKNRIHFDASQVFLEALDKSGRRTTQNKKLTYRPERTTKIGIGVDLNKLSLNYHKRLVGERFVTASNTVRLPSYTVDDLTMLIKQNFNKLHLNVKLSMFNLLDEEYEMVERAPLPGRHWRAGLELVYGTK